MVQAQSGKQLGCFFKKVNMLSPVRQIALLGIYLREMKTGSHKNLYRSVYSSFICDSPDLETTPVMAAFNKSMVKLTHIHTRECYSAMEKNKVLTPETTWKHLQQIILCAKKANPKGYILNNSICIT